MRTVIAFLVAGCCCLAVGVGCQNDGAKNNAPRDMQNRHDPNTRTPTTQVSADACSHCLGAQTATAEGTCPVCKMPVTSMK